MRQAAEWEALQRYYNERVERPVNTGCPSLDSRLQGAVRSSLQSIPNMPGYQSISSLTSNHNQNKLRSSHYTSSGPHQLPLPCYDNVDRDDSLDNERRTIVKKFRLHAASTKHQEQRGASTSKAYSLLCVQSPVHARTCGAGDKDRRALDPPPVVQCFEVDHNGQVIDACPFDMALTVHVSLWDATGTEDRSVLAATCRTRAGVDSLSSSEAARTTVHRMLAGSLVSSPVQLYNTCEKEGCFFIFSDLSVRAEGIYRLRFSLFSIDIPSLMIPGAKTTMLGHCISEPFTVYSAKQFPGMLKSTELTMAFAKQGMKLQVRSEQRRTSKVDDDMDRTSNHEH